MNTIRAATAAFAACISFALLSPAVADNDKGKGQGKGRGNDRAESRDNRDRNDDRRGEARQGDHREMRFEDRHRVAVREYYGQIERSGRCPPGLAKKHNGCQPPGQARKWQKGRPLPRDVVYYDVPQPLVVQLGVPPPGYKYVRVAGDILLIAVGSAMVIDAIQDLGR